MISWASPTEPLPMIRDPRVAFDQFFGAGGTSEQRAGRRRTNVVGGANGRLEGGVHLKAPDGTPMANALLCLQLKLGMDDMSEFSDSTGAFSLAV